MRQTLTDWQPIITDQYSVISDGLVVSKEADQRDRSDAAKLNGLICDLVFPLFIIFFCLPVFHF